MSDLDQTLNALLDQADSERPPAPTPPAPVAPPDGTLPALDALADGWDKERAAADAAAPTNAVNDTKLRADAVGATIDSGLMKSIAVDAKRAVERVLTAKGAGDPATLPQAIDELEKLGVPARQTVREGSRAAGLNKSDLDAGFARYLQDTGLWQIHGDFAPELLGRLRAEYTYKFALARSPLDPEEAVDAAASTVDQMMAEKIQQLTSTGDRSPETLAQLEVARKIQDLAPIAKRRLVAAGFESSGKPYNDYEEQEIERLKQTRTVQAIAGINAYSPEELAALAKTRAPLGAVDQEVAFKTAWGEGALSQLRDRYHNEVYARLSTRLGYADDPQGNRRPGYFDGVNFIDEVPERLRPAFDKLLGKAVESLPARVRSDPLAAKMLADDAPAIRARAQVALDLETERLAKNGEKWSRDAADLAALANPLSAPAPLLIERHSELFGDVAGFARSRELLQEHVKGLLVKATSEQNTVQALGDSPDLTPYARSKVSGLAQTGLFLSDTVSKMLHAASDGSKAAEAAISQLPFVQESAKAWTAWITNRPELAEAVRTPSDMVNITMRLMQADGLLRARMGSLASTPEGNAAVLRALTKPAQEWLLGQDGFLKSGMENEEARQARLAAQVRGTAPRDWGKTAADTANSLLFGMWYPIVSIGAELAEDPAGAAPLLATIPLANAGQSALVGAYRKLYHRALVGAATKNTMNALLTYTPDELMVRTRQALREAHLQPDPTAAHAALEDVRAALDQRFEALQKGDPAVPQKTVQNARDAALRAGPAFGEEFAALVDEKIKQSGFGNLWESVQTGLRNAPPAPGRLMQWMRSKELWSTAERALRDMVMAPGDTLDDAPTAYQRSISDFMGKNGRAPTLEELAATHPGEHVDLNRVVLAADSGTPTTLFGSLVEKIYKVGGKLVKKADLTETFDQVIQQAHAQLDAAHSEAIAQVNARQNWQRVRGQRDALLGHLRYKIQNRLNAETALQAGLETALQADPNQPLLAEALGQSKATAAEHGASLTLLAKERERLWAHKYTERWEDNGEIWRQLTPNALKTVMEENPVLFAEVKPGDVLERTATPVPKAALDAKIAKVDTQIRQHAADMDTMSRQNPVSSDATQKAMGAQVRRLRAARDRVAAMPERFQEPYSPEAVRRAVGEAHRRVFDALPKQGARAKGGEFGTVGDAVDYLDRLTQFATDHPDQVLRGEIPADLYARAWTVDERASIKEALQGGRDIPVQLTRRAIERVQKAVDLPGPLAEQAAADRPLHAQARAGAVDLAEYDQHIADTAASRQARIKALSKGTLQSDAFHAAQRTTERLRAERRRLVNRSGDEAVTYSYSRDGLQRLSDMLSHGGTAGVAHEVVEALQRDLAAGAGLKMRGNPFRFENLSFFGKARELHTMGLKMAAVNAAEQNRVESYAARVNKLSPAKRETLGAAQRAGKLPSEIDRSGWDQAVLNNLDALYKEDSAFFTKILNMNAEAGFISPAELDDMMRTGYDPGMYAAHERGSAVRDAETKHIGAQAAGGGGGVGLNGKAPMYSDDYFRMRRDVNHWRVRIEEPDQVVQQTFGSLGDAQEWYRKHYGAELPTVGQDNFGRGRTPFGDTLTVAEPLGQEAYDKLGALTGTADKRIKQLSTMYKDYFSRAYVQAVNMFGGLVLDDAAYTRLSQGQGTHVISQFVRMPGESRLWGDLAGKWVHRQVFSEMNHLRGLYDSMRSIVQGLQDSMEQAGAGPEIIALLGKQRSSPMRGINNIVKTSKILLSPRTWVSNFAFNVGIDKLMGSGVYEIRNVGGLLNSLREVFQPAKRSKLYYEAIEDGVLQGTFFTGTDAPNIHRAYARALGFDKDSVEVLQRRRAELQRDLGTAGTDLTIRANREIAAIDARLDELTGNMIKRATTWLVKGFTGGGDVTGQEVNAAGGALRKAYNAIDEHYKYSAYVNLRERFGRDRAAWMMKTFAQDYTNVPAQLRNNPFASLTVSFPWEMTRLSLNYLRHMPLRFIGAASAVAAINMMGLNMAGVEPDRMAAILRTRGFDATDDQAKYFASTLMIFDPRTKDLHDLVSLRNLFPFYEQTSARGLLGAAAKDLGADADTPTAMVVKNVVGYASNFFLNNPATSLVAMGLGYDPQTGNKITDPNMPQERKTEAFLKVLSAQFVPPIVPYAGSDMVRIQESLNAPYYPKTGRALRSPGGPTTEVLKALFNLEVRGEAPTAIDNLLGLGVKGKEGTVANDRDITMNLAIKAASDLQAVPGYAPEQYLESAAMDLRKAYLRSIDEALTEEEKKKAEAQFTQMVAANQEIMKGGVSTVQGLTAEEQKAFIARMRKIGYLDVYKSLPVDKKAWVLASLDKAGGHDDSILELALHITTDTAGDVEFESDPEKLQRAIDTLRKRGAEDGASWRLEKLARHLEGFKPAAEANAATHDVLREVNDKTEPAIDKVRREMNKAFLK